MKPLRKLLSGLCSRLPSFVMHAPDWLRRRRHLSVQALCVVTAIILIFAVSGQTLAPIISAVAQGVESNAENTEFEQLSFELYPNAQQNEKSVTLNGMMPKQASAEAVDVTGDFSAEGGEHAADEAAITRDTPQASVIAAYNITIMAGEEEYQPDEDRPILVEIAEPQLSEDTKTQLWHIKDDGTREKMTQFFVEDGKISFFATGFSVYAIVAVPPEFQFETATQVSELLSQRGQSVGFCLSYNTDNPRYFTTTVNGDDAIVETASPAQAAVYYFERANPDDTSTNPANCKVYTFVNGEKRYIHSVGSVGVELSATDADIFEVASAASYAFTLKDSASSRWLQHSGSGSGMRYYGSNTNSTNVRIVANYADALVKPDDYYGLDGKTFGLMNYPGGTVGYAFMAEGDTNSLSMMSLVVRNEDASRTLYVAEDSDITMWTFHNISSDHYTVSTVVNGQTRYLRLSGSTLSLAEEANATAFTVSSNSNNQFKLTSGTKSVNFDGTNFGAATTNTSVAQWLNIVETSGLENEDYVTYSSEKIGISDVPDGARVIVYTRIWNEDTKAYEFYAVDHDGSLYPCYERGDYIMWVGSRVNTLLWDFTEYHYDDGSPNYYYELYNNYSRKYIAPQITGGQTLSSSKIGLNMPGRRAGEYYSDIVAWDDDHYTYAGLKTDVENDRVTSSPRSQAETFYFAVVETPVPRLTEVATVDNNDYGITMKMIDFPVQSAANGRFQNEFLDTETDSYLYATKGLLSTNLNAQGYPTATRTNRVLSELYANETDANHLFLESTHSASGYFEFDSCQNFATLIQSDGTVGTDFTVYEELGSTDIEPKTTLKHGQFFPYDTIQAGVYSTVNPENLYSALAQPGVEEAGLLPDSDPRKYERLHTVGRSPNYYNGMEMSASFMQTPSGKDAWGHDIIFEFTGDDDFWLYVDGELVIDLGGIHSALAGNVNFATGIVTVEGVSTTLRDVFTENFLTRNPDATQAQIDAFLDDYFEPGETVFKDYSAHTMRIFYMERGAGASNLHMRFNLSPISDGTVVLTKNVSGADGLDYDLVEYPFQIWYKDEEYGDAKLLTSSDSLAKLSYQGSTKKVHYEAHYTPPGSSVTYDSVYFLDPFKNAEIDFPADTIEYRIVECGVPDDMYDVVTVNGTAVTGQSIGATDRNSYDSGWLTVAQRPNVVFDNHVKSGALRTLSFTKALYDEDGNILTAEDDGTTFSFRLYLSNGVQENLIAANMFDYYVKDSDGYFCMWNPATGRFEPTQKTDYSQLTDAEKINLAYETSMNGAISKIPAGYTVVVPNLPIGVHYRVEERPNEIPLGYQLTGYEHDATTYNVAAGDTLNSGWMRDGESPQITIKNKRGWEIMVDKVWSDAAYTDSHDSIFTAIYYGNTLVPGTVKQLRSPNTSLRYYFDVLPTGVNFTDYVVYEVELEDPVFDAAGDLIGYTAVDRRLNDGDLTTIAATAKNAQNPSNYAYEVEYEQGEPQCTAESVADPGNVRYDTITNTRTGGVVITLYDMNTREVLPGGIFTLTKNGQTIGTFTSDENGRVTILYNFEREEDYVLTETQPPGTYMGVPNAVVFSIGNDDSVTVSGNDAQWAIGYQSPVQGDKLIAYIDVFNKPFSLRVVKVDGDTQQPLAGAHFALYRAVDGIGGKVKDVNPVAGFEDLVSGADGVLPYITASLTPDRYYLTETQAPPGYGILEEDIRFAVTQSGTVTVIGEEHSQYMTTQGEASITYSINVPNERNYADLTVTKTVTGNQGERNRDFTFTLTVAGATAQDTYAWTKNGVVQSTPLTSGGTFTLRHGDTVTITVPQSTNITISEAAAGYTSTFRLGEEQAQQQSSRTFSITEDTTLAVTNERSGIVPTGIRSNIALAAVMLLLSAATAAAVITYRKKKQTPKKKT